MKLPAIPTLPGVMTRLENNLQSINAAGPQATLKQRAAARLTAGIATVIFSVVDEVYHAISLVWKSPVVGWNVSIGKLTGYSVKSPAVQGKAWTNHLEKMCDTFSVAVNALLVTLFVESPRDLLAFAKSVNLIKAAAGQVEDLSGCATEAGANLVATQV